MQNSPLEYRRIAAIESYAASHRALAASMDKIAICLDRLSTYVQGGIEDMVRLAEAYVIETKEHNDRSAAALERIDATAATIQAAERRAAIHTATQAARRPAPKRKGRSR